ncbi:MAG: hypothetical protein DRO09_02215 [Thermoprotei archaeon]|nr:MAG: hypothetical protein DRO09_02215 [Thermoprotei archaeon]
MGTAKGSPTPERNEQAQLISFASQHPQQEDQHSKRLLNSKTEYFHTIIDKPPQIARIIFYDGRKWIDLEPIPTRVLLRGDVEKVSSIIRRSLAAIQVKLRPEIAEDLHSHIYKVFGEVYERRDEILEACAAFRREVRDEGKPPRHLLELPGLKETLRVDGYEADDVERAREVIAKSPNPLEALVEELQNYIGGCSEMNVVVLLVGVAPRNLANFEGFGLVFKGEYGTRKTIVAAHVLQLFKAGPEDETVLSISGRITEPAFRRRFSRIDVDRKLVFVGEMEDVKDVQLLISQLLTEGKYVSEIADKESAKRIITFELRGRPALFVMSNVDVPPKLADRAIIFDVRWKPEEVEEVNLRIGDELDGLKARIEEWKKHGRTVKAYLAEFVKPAHVISGFFGTLARRYRKNSPAWRSLVRLAQLCSAATLVNQPQRYVWEHEGEHYVLMALDDVIYIWKLLKDQLTAEIVGVKEKRIKALYDVMLEKASNEDNAKTVRELAALLETHAGIKVSNKTVRRYLNKLADMGFIHILKGAGPYHADLYYATKSSWDFDLMALPWREMLEEIRERLKAILPAYGVSEDKAEELWRRYWWEPALKQGVISEPETGSVCPLSVSDASGGEQNAYTKAQVYVKDRDNSELSLSFMEKGTLEAQKGPQLGVLDTDSRYTGRTSGSEITEEPHGPKVALPEELAWRLPEAVDLVERLFYMLETASDDYVASYLVEKLRIKREEAIALIDHMVERGDLARYGRMLKLRPG